MRTYRLFISLVLAILLVAAGCGPTTHRQPATSQSFNQTPTAIPSPPGTIATSGTLTVHFIDVGQGDSILVQAPDGKTYDDATRGWHFDVFSHNIREHKLWIYMMTLQWT